MSTLNSTGLFNYTTDDPPTSPEPIPPAQVTITSIPFTDADVAAQSTGSPLGIWNDFRVTNRYESDKHRYMMGIASPDGFAGATVAFVQTTSPTLLWICDWTSSKAANTPEIPSNVPIDSKWILLDEHYEPAHLLLMAGGNRALYRISGTYVYGHKNPSSVVVNNINYARPPWMSNVFDRTVATAKMQAGVIDGTA